MALPLTAPALLPLCAFVWLALAIKSRRRLANLTLIAAGAFVLWIPWQAYCVSATGRIQWRLLSSAPSSTDGFWVSNTNVIYWIRTWLVRPDDVAVVWDGDAAEAGRIPASAFDSENDRRYVLNNWQEPPLDDRGEEILQSTASQRISRSPIRYLVLPTLIRCGTLWFDAGEAFSPTTGYESKGYVSDFNYVATRQLAHLQPSVIQRDYQSYGARRTIMLIVLALYSLVGIGLYTGIHFWLLAISLHVLHRRSTIAIAVVAGTLFYTIFASWLGSIEVRRNLPFLPWLFYLLFFRGSIRRFQERSRGHDGVETAIGSDGSVQKNRESCENRSAEIV